jgi:hypothetical protein
VLTREFGLEHKRYKDFKGVFPHRPDFRCRKGGDEGEGIVLVI